MKFELKWLTDTRRIYFLIIFIFCTIPNHGLTQNLEGLNKQKPMSITGSLSARAIFYNAGGIANRRVPFSYILNGSPVISIYNLVVIPLSFTYSEQDRVFRQPFNQFGMSPYYKWIKVHGGYRNVTFSQFTLGGHTFLGGGLELTPGLLRFGFIYGRFNRATPIDSSSRAYQPYTYLNKGFAGKIGIGKADNFFDLSFVKAKDYVNSVQVPSNYVGSVTPAENLAFGMNAQIKVLKLFIYALEASTSVYTRNIQPNSLRSDSLNDKIINACKGLLITNNTTERNNAVQTSLSFQKKNLSIKLQYRRVDPGYKSMGAYFFNNDLENIALAPSAQLWHGRLKIGGSIGFQHDNLKGQKQTTSKRTIGSTNLSVQFSDRWGFDAGYSNYSNSQQRKTILLRDTFRIAQVAQNFSATPRYILTNERHVHVLILSVNYNLFSRVDKSVDDMNDTKTYNTLFNYQITFVPRNLSLSMNWNYTLVTSDVIDQGNYGVTLGVSKSMDSGKLTLGWNGAFLRGINNDASGLILNHTGTLAYKVNKHHSMAVAANYINNKSHQTEYTPSFTEWKGDLNYRYTF